MKILKNNGKRLVSEEEKKNALHAKKGQKHYATQEKLEKRR